MHYLKSAYSRIGYFKIRSGFKKSMTKIPFLLPEVEETEVIFHDISRPKDTRTFLFHSSLDAFVVCSFEFFVIFESLAFANFFRCYNVMVSRGVAVLSRRLGNLQYSIVQNPRGDGDCFYSAAGYQLGIKYDSSIIITFANTYIT